MRSGAAGMVVLPAAAVEAAVLHVGLDRFDQLGDVLGPVVADQVMRTTAQRLTALAPAGTRVERAGAGDLVVICPSLGGHGLQRFAAEVLAAVQRSVLVDGGDVHVTASVGVAAVDGDTTDLEGLLTDAHAAMRAASSDGGAQIVVHRQEMRHAARQRMTLGAELRQAVDNDELVVHYQPTWDPATLQVVGVEALVRWNHPTLGLLPPEEFIPVAEDSGLIVPVGRWVLTHATQQLDAWCRDPELVTDELVMAVNLSVRQLQDPGLIDDVARLLAGVAFAPRQLCIEITETVLLQEGAIARLTLSGLRQLGVHLAIDDFGTGFSSLAALRQLPVDQLKIDRSFIRDLAVDRGNQQVVRAIVGLAHGLALEVVAEGIETAADLDAVRALDCDVVQGFGLARPAAADSMTAMLRRTVHQPMRAATRRFGQMVWNGSPTTPPAWATPR